MEADSSLAYSFTHHVEKQIGIEGNRVRELQGVLLQEGIMWAAPEESTHLEREDFQLRELVQRPWMSVCLEEYLREGECGFSEASEKRSETLRHGIMGAGLVTALWTI